MRCWGRNIRGQLGYGNITPIGDNELPSSVGPVDLGDNAVAITAGDAHTCVLTDQQTVRCWGFNGYGELGLGHTDNIGDNEAPATASTVSLGGPVSSITSGEAFSCALLVSGEVRCWGFNGSGELGLGHTASIGDDELPSSVGAVVLGNTPIVEVATGNIHACVRYDDGSMRCWGYAHYGQLGYANTTNIGDDELPTDVGTVSVGGSVDELALGLHHTCVRMGTDVKCWGYGGSGGNGRASTAHLGDNELPSSFGTIALDLSVTALSAGCLGVHHCARSDATIRCWGYNLYGQLGYGNTHTIGDDELPNTAGPVPYL